jgi:hypothetical protein
MAEKRKIGIILGRIEAKDIDRGILAPSNSISLPILDQKARNEDDVAYTPFEASVVGGMKVTELT